MKIAKERLMEEIQGTMEELPSYYPYRKKFVRKAEITFPRSSPLGQRLEAFACCAIGRKGISMDNHTSVQFGEIVMTFHDFKIYIGTGTRPFDG